MKRHRRWIFLLLSAALVWSACSSSEPTTQRGSGPPAAEAPSSGEAERPRGPVTRTMQGFRIQVHTSSDKGEAEARLDEALTWWQSAPAAQDLTGFDDDTFGIAWQQPYYRVRLGAFASRQEAQQALGVVKQHFGDAFIVPDRVTITR